MPGPRHMQMAKPKSASKTFLRIIGYMFRQKWLLAVVLILVLVNAGAGVAGTYFLKPILNNYIVPFIGKKTSIADLFPFIRMLAVMGRHLPVGRSLRLRLQPVDDPDFQPDAQFCTAGSLQQPAGSSHFFL